MNVLGFDVNLKKSPTFSTQNIAGIEMNVSLFIIPMRYFQPALQSISAIGAGALSKWGAAKIGGKRIPKMVPWLVGLGVASASLFSLFFNALTNLWSLVRPLIITSNKKRARLSYGEHLGYFWEWRDLFFANKKSCQ